MKDEKYTKHTLHRRAQANTFHKYIIGVRTVAPDSPLRTSRHRLVAARVPRQALGYRRGADPSQQRSQPLPLFEVHLGGFATARSARVNVEIQGLPSGHRRWSVPEPCSLYADNLLHHRPFGHFSPRHRGREYWRQESIRTRHKSRVPTRASDPVSLLHPAESRAESKNPAFYNSPHS